MDNLVWNHYEKYYVFGYICFNYSWKYTGIFYDMHTDFKQQQQQKKTPQKTNKKPQNFCLPSKRICSSEASLHAFKKILPFNDFFKGRL